MSELKSPSLDRLLTALLLEIRCQDKAASGAFILHLDEDVLRSTLGDELLDFILKPGTMNLPNQEWDQARAHYRKAVTQEIQ